MSALELEVCGATPIHSKPWFLGVRKKCTKRLPNGCQKGAKWYQKGTDISYNKPKILQKNLRGQIWMAVLWEIEFLIENGWPKGRAWEPFWIQKWFKINATIDTGRIKKMMSKGYQIVIKIDTQYTQKSMPKQVAKKMMKIINNHIVQCKNNVFLKV